VPFQAARLILLNGIEDVISLPDLADRALFLTLPPIADALRGNFRGRAASASRIVARGRCAWAAKPAGGHGMRNGMLAGRHLSAGPQANRRAIEDLIDEDAVAVRVQEIITNRSA
jgi:hypothetical protein